VAKHSINRRQILSWATAATATSLVGTFGPRPSVASAQAASLEVWINRGAPQGDLIAELVGKYNAELAQSGGTVEWKTQNIKEGIDAKLAAAATAGSGFPDLYIGDDSLSWLGRYIQAGWVAPLNPILEQVEFNWDDFLPGTRWQLDGQDYVVNYGPSGFMQYINLDHVQEAGLDLKASPPDSQEALIEWAEKLTQRDASGNVTRSGFLVTGSGLQPTVVWGTVLQSLGSSLVGPDRQSTNFNNEHGVTAAQFVLDCFNKYKVADPNVSDRYKEWQTGNASIFWSGDWVIGSSLAQENLNFDVWKMPTFAGQRASQASLEAIVIFQQDDQARMLEAGKLIKWFIDHLAEFEATIGDITPTKSVQEDPTYKDRPANKYLWPVDDAYENKYTFAQISHPEQNLNYYGGEVLSRNLDKVWLGQVSIQDGLNALDQEVSDILAIAPILDFKLV
jgi:maltose-binding protein MalE